MPLDAFLELSGIEGSSRQKGREGHITIRGYKHVLESPVDLKGKSTGPLRSGYLIVQKDLDLASPLLYQSLHEDKKIGQATLRFWRMPPSGGREENYYSISLTGVKIVSISAVMPYNREQEKSLLPEMEEVAFRFDSIGYAFASGGAEGSSEKRTTKSSGPFRLDEFDVLNSTVEEMVKKSATDALKSAATKVMDAVKERAKEEAGGGAQP